MKLFYETSRSIKAFSIPALLTFVLVYTYYQMLTGDRGLMTWYELNQQVGELSQENAALTQQRGLMETKVARLRDDTLDVDFVDELSRRMLPVTRSNEKVYYLN